MRRRTEIGPRSPDENNALVQGAAVRKCNRCRDPNGGVSGLTWCGGGLAAYSIDLLHDFHCCGLITVIVLPTRVRVYNVPNLVLAHVIGGHEIEVSYRHGDLFQKSAVDEYQWSFSG
jgi:hypothetical protein